MQNWHIFVAETQQVDQACSHTKTDVRMEEKATALPTNTDGLFSHGLIDICHYLFDICHYLIE